jgi:antitoxin CptB
MDMLVGGFAARELPHMTATELRIFENLLEIPDQQLLAFVTEQEDVPSDMDGPMLRAILNFRLDLKT